MTFSIKKSFKESWDIFTSKKLYIPFILTGFVIGLGAYIIFSLFGMLSMMLLMRGLWIVLLPIILIFLFFGVYFIIASINLALHTYKTKTVDFKKTFSSVWNFKLITKSVGLVLLIGGGAIVIGYLLFLGLSKIHPVVGALAFAIWVAFVAVRFAFSIYILVDAKETIISSIKKSHQMMKGNGWKFLLFIICATIISAIIQVITGALGMVSPIISGIITILIYIGFTPWFSLLTVSPYIQIKGH